MAWTKLIDNYSGGPFTSDDLHVGGQEFARVIVDGILTSLELQVWNAVTVPDGSGGFERQEGQVAEVNPASGNPVGIALNVSGGLTIEVPCPGDFLFFKGVGAAGTATNLDVYIMDKNS